MNSQSEKPTSLNRNGATDFIYPSIKEETNIILLQITKDTIPGTTEEITYFSLSFRMSNAVLNAIAAHYETPEDYPLGEEDEEEERFLLGPYLVQEFCKKMPTKCLYMDKAMEIINNTKELVLRDIIGIYLFGTDNYDANKQRFLVMTVNRIYLRDDSLVLKDYDYEDIVIDDDGLHLKASVESLGEPKLWEYPFDKRFISFFRDFMLLKFTILSDRIERHPFVDRPMDHRNEYLKFMVIIALSEHRMSVEQLLYLEILAREFHLGSTTLEEMIKAVFKKKTSDRKIRDNLIEITKNYIPAEYMYVFFQDVLRLAINNKGELNQNVILEIISKDNYAGEKFVTAYVEYIKAENTMKEKLMLAMSNVKKRPLTIEPTYQLQQLCRDFFIKILRTGVTYNDFERI